ncbi:hypothetical protein ACJX0J_014908, partial [Zea mays]
SIRASKVQQEKVQWTELIYNTKHNMTFLTTMFLILVCFFEYEEALSFDQFLLVYAVFPYLELDMINMDLLLLYFDWLLQSAYCVIEDHSCMENHNPLHSHIAERSTLLAGADWIELGTSLLIFGYTPHIQFYFINSIQSK